MALEQDVDFRDLVSHNLVLINYEQEPTMKVIKTIKTVQVNEVIEMLENEKDVTDSIKD